MSGDKTKAWHTPSKLTFEEAAALNTGSRRLTRQIAFLIAVISDPRLGEVSIPRLLLAAVVQHINRDTGTAYPGSDRLAEEIYRELNKLPPKTAKAVLDNAATLVRYVGYVLTKRMAPPDGGRAIAHYTIDIPDPDERRQAISVYEAWLAGEASKEAARNGRRTSKANGTSPNPMGEVNSDLTQPVRTSNLTQPVRSEGADLTQTRGADLTQTANHSLYKNLDLNLKKESGANAPAGGEAGSTEELSRNPKVEARSSPKSATPAADPVAAFERFWDAFPPGRKRDKADTRDLFVAIVSGKHKKRRASAEVIIAAAERYAASRPDPQYTPMPSTWLNGGRWEDDECQPKRHAALSDEEAELAATLARMRAEEGWR